jgi:hypothetical protein
MKFTTPARRLLAAGAVSALAAGTLVGATTSSAQAAVVTDTYSCTTQLGPQEVTIEADIANIESTPDLAAGQAVDPTGLLDAVLTFTISDTFHGLLLNSLGVDDLTVPNYDAVFGNSRVPTADFAASVSEMTQNEDGSWSSTVSTEVLAFEAPRAGEWDVTVPDAFTIIATVSGTEVPSECAVDGTPSTLATVVVTKNESTSNATAVNSPVKKGDVAKIKVKVTAPNETPSGKVLLKKGTKTLTKGNLNDKGIVVLKTKALPVGKTKLTTAYKGDGYTKPSKDTVVVTVKR